MQVRDVIKLLEGFGFSGLSPTKVDGNTTTLKFAYYKHNYLTKTFGVPSLVQSGKVAVFEIPGYGRLGVSPSASVVRLIYSGKHRDETESLDTHLAKVPTNPALKLLFAKAQASPALRLKYVEQALAFFNKDRFHGRMPKIKVLVSASPPKGVKQDSKTRAFFMSSVKNPYFWFRDGLFNAQEDFVNEIILHEQCHQAVFVDLGKVETVDRGHGPAWKAWMVKVGLDPRRYDPTEDYTYLTKQEQVLEDEKYTALYGPRTPPSTFKSLRPAPKYDPDVDAYILLYEGRAFTGTISKVGNRFLFKCLPPNRKKVLTFKLAQWPEGKIWYDK